MLADYQLNGQAKGNKSSEREREFQVWSVNFLLGSNVVVLDRTKVTTHVPRGGRLCVSATTSHMVGPHPWHQALTDYYNISFKADSPLPCRVTDKLSKILQFVDEKYICMLECYSFNK